MHRESSRKGSGRGSRKGSGFTAVELLLVIVLLSILAAAALPGFARPQTRALLETVEAQAPKQAPCTVAPEQAVAETAQAAAHALASAAAPQERSAPLPR